MTNNYNPTQIQTCLPSRRLVFIGDSITRQLFYSMAKLADPTAPDGPPEGGGKHMDQVWKSAKGQSKERDSRFGFRGLKGDELDADFSLPRLEPQEDSSFSSSGIREYDRIDASRRGKSAFCPR